MDCQNPHSPGPLRLLSRLFCAAFIALGVSARANVVTFEEVTLALPDGAGALAGTLAHVQDGDTVVLMVAGSGPTDRDGNQPHLKNDSLRQVAEGLASLGVSTLRYDKRGAGHSVVRNLREDDVQLQTYAGDVERWVARLREQGRFQRIGILGHSEGGLVATLVAQKLAVDFVMLLEAPGRPFDEVLKAQLARKLPEEQARSAASIIDSLKAGRPVADVPDTLRSVFRPSLQPYWASMFAQEPADLVARLSMPLLILQGDQDLQVDIGDAARLAAARPSASACLVTGMNHVLKHVEKPADQNRAYTDPSVPLSTEVLRDMALFLKTLIQDSVHAAKGTFACPVRIADAVQASR